MTEQPPEDPVPDELNEPEMDPTRPTDDSEELAEGVQDEASEQQTHSGPRPD